MAKSNLLYEEIRKKRVEENKKRMEELNLKNLSLNLRSKLSKPRKQGKPKTPKLPLEFIPVRRSGRVADKPPVSYKEVPMEPLERPRRSYNRRNLLNREYASDEERQYAISRAEQLKSSLEPDDLPCFVKPMLQSHVTGGFWLGLPKHFCVENLPHEDETFTLEDESGDLSDTKYLADKHGLSGGWRGFAMDHELVDGDCLVFQLVNPTQFKVYIIRVCDAEDRGDEENNEANAQELDPAPVDTIAKRTRSSKKYSPHYSIL